MMDKQTTTAQNIPDDAPRPTAAVNKEWGEVPEDHFGYSSDEDRKNKRGLEDWELVEKIPESQRRIPTWFIGIIIMILLIAFGLSLPFWGDRPGHPRPWLGWGQLIAVAYTIGGGAFIYFMTRLYGSERAGHLDNDPDKSNPDDDDIDMPK